MTLPIEEEINVWDWPNIVNSITYKQGRYAGLPSPALK